MSGLRSKLKNAVQVAVDLLLPINCTGRWRNPESRATQFGRRWGTTVDRENGMTTERAREIGSTNGDSLGRVKDPRGLL